VLRALRPRRQLPWRLRDEGRLLQEALGGHALYLSSSDDVRLAALPAFLANKFVCSSIDR
jgi:hypothetical protein